MKHPVYSLFRHSESQYAAGLIYLLVLLCVAGELQVVAEDLGAGSGGLSVAPLLVALHLIQELGLLQEYLRLARKQNCNLSVILSRTLIITFKQIYLYRVTMVV